MSTPATDGSTTPATVTGGTEPWMVLSVVGVAVAIGGLGWAAFRTGTPLLGLAR